MTIIIALILPALLIALACWYADEVAMDDKYARAMDHCHRRTMARKTYRAMMLCSLPAHIDLYRIN